MNRYDPLNALLFRYRKHKTVSLHGRTSGVEYNRQRGGYVTADHTHYSASPVAPDSVDYLPHPGWPHPADLSYENGEPEYEPPQYAAEHEANLWTPEPRHRLSDVELLNQEESIPTYESMLRAQAAIDAVLAEEDAEQTVGDEATTETLEASLENPWATEPPVSTEVPIDFAVDADSNEIDAMPDDAVPWVQPDAEAFAFPDPQTESGMAQPGALNLEEIVEANDQTSFPMPMSAEEPDCLPPDPFEDPMMPYMIDPFAMPGFGPGPGIM